MSQLLTSVPIKEPREDPPHNAINGSDAESFALVRVLAACRGEGQWGSREDDNAKIDLLFSLTHPWNAGERILVLSQVKSGESYGAQLTSGGFKLKASAKKSAKRTSHAICLIWVNRETSQVFWAYVHPTSNSSTQVYGSHHRVTPAMMFDLARCTSKHVVGGIGGNGVTVSSTVKGFQNGRRRAHRIYKAINSVESPLLGEVQFTRFGWRHMFRRSRSTKYKASSVDIVPFLKVLLKQRPSSNMVTSTTYQIDNMFEYRTCEYLLKYEKTSVFRRDTHQTEPATSYIKVVEEIRYPKNWADLAMISQLVKRRVVLKSAYFKAG